jgi:hypothetical protein
MKLSDLKKAGGFVSSEPVKTSVKWNTGKKDAAGEDIVHQFEVFIIRQSIGSVEKIYSDKDEDRSKMAMTLSKSVKFGEKGEESLTYEAAYQLDQSLALALIEAIKEVNGAAKN